MPRLEASASPERSIQPALARRYAHVVGTKGPFRFRRTPMQSQSPVQLTPEAMKELKAELDHLRINRRREVADMLRQTRENDWSEQDDASYDPARDEQAFVEGRILELEQLLAHAQVLESPGRNGRVGLGSTVV